MDPPDPSQSPGRNFFDPTSLLGSSPFSPAVSAANPYAHLAHMPSAFSLLGRHPGFPGAPPFGGLGSLADPLRSPGTMLSPTTGGADWWRAASDHVRCTAGFGDVDYLAGSLPPHFGPPPGHITSGENGAIYRRGEDSSPKYLNGAYSSLFGLPSYTSASASTSSTKSSPSTAREKQSSSSSHKSSSSKTDAQSSPSSSHGKRASSPASSTHSLSSAHNKDSSSYNSLSEKSSRHSDSHGHRDTPNSPKTKNGPSTSVASVYDEEVAKSLSSIFSFPDSSAMLAPSMFAAPPLFSYPYGAGALFAAHHASLFGSSMPPGHLGMPYPMAASPPAGSPHSTHSTKASTSSSSSAITKTTVATATTPSVIPTSSSVSGSTSSPSGKMHLDGELKGRKSLFNEHSEKKSASSSSSSARTSAHSQNHKKRKQSSPKPKVRGVSSDSDSIPDVSSDSLSDDSDLENDHSSEKAKHKKMPQLAPVSLSQTKQNCSEWPSSDLGARPPTPDLVQDLSMKKRRTSDSSHISSSSVTNTKKESHSHHSNSHKTSTSSALSSAHTLSTLSPSSTSSSGKQNSPAISSPSSFPMSMPMHSSYADMTAQHMESLFGAGHLPPKLPMFFHPAAAMMAPMLDSSMSMSLLLPPPPSSAQASSSRGRGRGRGRGSRGNRSSTTSSKTASGSPEKQVRGRGRPGRPRGSKSRGRSSSSLDYAALSRLQVSTMYEQMYSQQLQEEQHQAALREHMELQLKAHQQMAAIHMSQDPHQMALQLAKESSNEATNKLHQLADAHAAASRKSDDKPKSQSTKLSNALMGQPVSLPAGKSPSSSSYTPSKHSEATSDSDGEDNDSFLEADTSGTSGSDSDTDDTDMGAQSSQDSETASYTTQGSKRPGDESDSTTPRKKRRRIHEIDETEIRIPLEYGWRRQTRLRGIGSRGLIGEVIYFAPCGKKLKTVPDVARYLEKNEISDLVRSNFTFSTKVNVGDFLEAQSEDANSGYVALTEEEVVERFMMVAQRKRAKLIAKQERAERRKLRKQQAAEMAQRMAEAKVAKRMEQQEMARRISEMKMRRKMERQQARESARREKQIRAMEMKKMKEQERIMRQQEKVQRQEQMRIEREMRAQQIMEEKQRRKDELQRRMYEDALQKAKDREMKRQQAVMMKEQAGPAIQTLSLDGTLFGPPSPAPASTRGLDEVSPAGPVRPIYTTVTSPDERHPLSTSSHWSTGTGSILTYTTTSAHSTSATTAPALRLPSITGSGDLLTSTPSHSGAGVGQYGPYTELLYQSVVSHAAQQERERRKQMMVMASLERERRRQHMLLVKALEARKRHEDREKAKEDKRNEKIMERDRKMEQRKIEMEIARELRKPVEDMMINSHHEMPKIDRITGVCLAGKAFADTLMVIEFLNNFGTALGFDDESLPTIQELQSGLLGNEDDVDELVMVITHLLKFAIDDPGFPSQKEAVTPSGLKITDLEVTEENMSEILRIFVRARNAKDDEMTDWLLDKPLLALTPTQKAACLAFLCNELLSSKSIYGEIEKNIEGLCNLRRDKWMSEGKVRKYRMMQARKLRAQTNAIEAGSEAAGSKKGSDDEEDGEKDKDDEEEESDNDSDGTNATGNVSDEEEDLNLEEIEKKIEKINKQQTNYNRKVNDCTNRLRAQDLGQDRYKRRYWVLPHAGGVFVEAMESAETDPEADTESDEEMKEEKEGKKEKGEEEKTEEKIKAEQGNEIESKENGQDANVKEEGEKVEKMDIEEGKRTIREAKFQKVLDNTKADEVKDNCNAKEERYLEVEEEKTVPSKMVNGVKKEHDGEPDALYDNIQKKLEKIAKDRADKDSTASCVKVEMNGKRTDETMVVENGDIKEEPGLGLDLKLTPDLKRSDKLKNTDSLMERTEPDGLDLSQKEKCVVNGSPEDKCSAFKVPSTSASSLLLAKAEGNTKLVDVLGTPPTFRTPPSSFTTPPPSSLDIFKSAQNQYSIPNSHTEIASSFRSIDTILGSPDHKSTPRSSSSPLFNSSFLSPQNVLSSTPVSAEQMLKDLSQRSLQDTWFSILPRMPCDEMSITRSTSSYNCSTSQSGAIYSTANINGTPLSGSHSNLNSLRGSPVDFQNSSQSSIFDKFNLSGLNLSRNEDGSINLAELGIRDNCLHKEPKRIPKDTRHGWWRITSTEQLQAVMKCLHARGIRERCLNTGIEKYFETAGNDANKDFQKDLITLTETDLYKEITKTPIGAPEPDSRCGWSEPECQKAEAAALEEVEALEERVFSASLQVKGCTLKSKVSEDEEKEGKSPKGSEETDESIEDDREPIEIAREKLLQLEKNIERRYLKPPLAKGVQINLANLSGNTSMPHDDSDADDDEDDVPVPLVKWREAVSTAVSAAQMHLCVFQLNKCIAWEKSIMKVSCQICRKDDNEAELLLCDSCDKGYHTYCFKPKMEDIPEGDWYCYACISKATGEPTCVVCGRKGPKIASCEGCTHAMHIECMDPPLPRLPRRYACHTCSSSKSKGRRNRKPPPKAPPSKDTKGAEKSIEKSESDTSQQEQPTPEKEKKDSKKEPKEKEKKEEKGKSKEKDKEKEKEKETTPKKGEKKGEKKKAEKPILRESSRNADKTDLTPCRTLLAELERHEEAWPFIEPVNTKQFPSYKKVIKHPMDLQAMKHKLRDNVYKLRDEFAADARLMFNNCQVFNEDESEVGQAGFILRSFFEKRWKELGCS